jgi:hypothetical protein
MINLTQDLHLVQENCIPFKYLNKMRKKTNTLDICSLKYQNTTILSIQRDDKC